MSSISNNQIAQAIYLSTKGKRGRELGETLENTTRFLIRRRLTSRAPDILSRLNQIINEKEGTVVAKATSAKKLGGIIKKDLIHLLKKHYLAKEVLLEEQIDERVLGGVRIEVGDEVIDLTLKNKIGQLKDYLMRKV